MFKTTFKRSPRRLKPDARCGGRPKLGKVAFKFTLQPTTLLKIGRAAFSLKLDRCVFIEQACLAAFDPTARVSSGYYTAQHIRGSSSAKLTNNYGNINGCHSYEIYLNISIASLPGNNVWQYLKCKGLPPGDYWLTCNRTANYNDVYYLWTSSANTGICPTNTQWLETEYEGSCASGNNSGKSIDIFNKAVALRNFASMTQQTSGVTAVWKFTVL